MPFFMVDVESDGPIPDDYSMICLGAVIVGPALDHTFCGQLRSIAADFGELHPDVLAVNGLSREQMLAFPEPAETMRNFRQSVEQHARGRAMFISDHNGFDWQFINYYLHLFTRGAPLGHSSTNLGLLYKGLVKDMTLIFKHLRKTKHAHHPLDAPRGNAQALLMMKE